jgi:hypothetical protein
MLKIETQNAPTIAWFDDAVSADAGKATRSHDLLRAELAPVRRAFVEYRGTRDRDAVYRYLDAVFGLVEKWNRLRCAKRWAKRALRQQNLRPSGQPDPFAAVIVCTAQTDSRTTSKWARALRYAAAVKKKPEPLAGFIHRNGGINACAGLWSRNQDKLRSRR